jgi:hypothetical protein
MAYMFGRRNQPRKKCRWRLDTWWADPEHARLTATEGTAETPASVSRDDLEEYRCRALAAVGGGAEVKEPAAGLGDWRGRDEELALGLPLDNQQAV